MRSGPQRTGELTGPELVKILQDVLAEAKQIGVVVFGGGEPLLLGETLLDGIRAVHAMGKFSRVITNGYWAHSLDEARRVLRTLRAAGLDELNISTDDQHLPYVSLQRVRWAYQAAMELDFLSVGIASCGGPKSILTPEMLDTAFGETLDRRFAPDGTTLEQHWTPGKTKVVLSNARLQRTGRGVDRIADDELPPAELALAGGGGCPYALRGATISPGGHLLACCGFELENNPVLDYGNLKTRPAAEVLDAADADLATNLIAIIGPPKLKKLLEERWPDEVRFERDYRTYCEVCWDLVHVPENREALLRHQGEFADVVLAVRDQLKELWANAEGEVVLPLELLVSHSLADNEAIARARKADGPQP
jgi:hypothetical protein